MQCVSEGHGNTTWCKKPYEQGGGPVATSMQQPWSPRGGGGGGPCNNPGQQGGPVHATTHAGQHQHSLTLNTFSPCIPTSVNINFCCTYNSY